MDLEALAASARTALTHYNRTRGRRRRTREAAAKVLVLDIIRAADQLAEADLAAAKAQESQIVHLKRELNGQTAIAEELREQVTGARNELASFGGQLSAAQARIADLEQTTQARIAELEQAARDHLCEPLPQRVRTVPQWSDAAREPASATEQAPHGSESPAKQRKPRNPVRDKGASPQAVTDAPEGAA